TQNKDGEVRLRGNNPFERPEILFNYFDESNPLGDPDLAAMVKGVRFVRQIEDRARQMYSDQMVDEVWPGSSVASDAELAAWIRKETWGHHACCTDKVGREDDPDAVLDARLRVIGAKNLRVVDAS